MANGMPSPSLGTRASSPGPEDEYSQEVRFAVVMYGGVSLAIYINGVAQELLKLVRATAPLCDGKNGKKHVLPKEKLNDTERVYRMLGRALARNKPLIDWETLKREDEAGELAPRTRFVVDILSGSSAGGINSVALAKALAKNQPLKQLKELWVDEGDFGRLINDRRSIEDTKLAPQVPPRSLLNSQRMYLKLYSAFDRMDRTPIEEKLQLVDELDLFVTATDMKGQPVNLTLTDKFAVELRHRAVFHFRHRGIDSIEGQCDDFKDANTAFLAFAARCTSAFPGAFEPMHLKAIDDILPRHATNGEAVPSASNKDWEKFYADYLRGPDDKPLDSEIFLGRYFNDGGTLDNKPFSYAIDTLPMRTTKLPVNRKLVYIEPSPEDISRPVQPGDPPTFLSNIWSSLSTLPRYETIREDLERVLERNQLIERVNRIIAGVEDDLLALYKHGWDDQPIGKKWDELSFNRMLELKGLAWGGYQRLRVSELTDDLARLVARLVGFDTNSSEFEALRHLVSYWRQLHYAPNPPAGNQPQPDGSTTTQAAGAPSNASAQARAIASEHQFLRQYDIQYRLRRLKYAFTRINELGCLSGEELDKNKIVVLKRGNRTVPLSGADLDAFREELESLKEQLSKIYLELSRSRHALWQTMAPNSELVQKIKGLDIRAEDLRPIVDPERRSDGSMMGFIPQSLEQRIKSFYETGDRPEQFEEIANLVSAALEDLLEHSGDNCRAILDASNIENPNVKLAREVIGHYFNRFSDYDMVIFPTIYASDVGDELDTIDIFRISPRDATELVDEKDYGPKLAGTLFSNFGAFARRAFRTNDLVWGRLDGAERIISALLPGKDTASAELRKKLIDEAHKAIIEEEIIPDDIGFQEQERLRGLLQQALDDPTEDEQRYKLLSEIQRRVDILRSAEETTNADEYSGPYRWGESPLNYFRRTHKTTDRSLEAAETIRNAARASRVVGQMLQDYADHQQAIRSPLVWVTRLTQLFWSLVEVALPDSVQHLIFIHWMKLLYFFELLMIALGTLLVNAAVQQFGFVAFVVTITIHAAVLILQDAVYAEQPPPVILTQAVPPSSRKKSWLFPLFLAVFAFLPFVVVGSAVFGAIFGASGFRQFVDLLLSPSDAPDPTKFLAVGALIGLPVLMVLVSVLWVYREPWDPERRRRDNIVQLARWLPPVGGLVVLLLTLRGLLWLPAKPGLGAFRLPALALELASGEQQLRRVVEAYPKEAIGTALALDSLIFIPIYCVLYACLGLSLIKVSKMTLSKVKFTDRYVFALGACLIVCIVAAAAADYVENYYSWQAIAAQTEQIADAILTAALVKWWLFVAIMGLLAAAFLRFGSRVQHAAILYMIAAVIGAAGLLQHYPLVEWFFVLLGVALLPTGSAIWSIVQQRSAAAAAARTSSH